MNRIIAVLIGLLIAVHVRVGFMPAPLPVLAAMLGVIAVLLFLIWEAAHPAERRPRRAVPPWARS